MSRDADTNTEIFPNLHDVVDAVVSVVTYTLMCLTMQVGGIDSFEQTWRRSSMETFFTSWEKS